MRGRVIATLMAAVVAVVAVVVANRDHEDTARLRTTAPAVAPDDIAEPAQPAVAGPVDTTTSTTATTTTTIDLGATDRLERTQPLVRVLPHDTPHYRIDYRVGAGDRLVLTIELLAVLNNANQLAAYQDQLRQYKAEALGFLRAQGQDPATHRIEYRPPEAAAL